MEKAFWNRFLDFEKENHLFDLQDKYGTYYWDIFRCEIYSLLLWEGGGVSSPQKRTIKNIILKVFSIFHEFFKILFLCSKTENLFYLSSRNKIKGQYIDQNSRSVYELFPEEKKIVIESYNPKNNLRNSYFLPQRIFKIFRKKKIIDFSFLINLLEKEFGKLPFNEVFLQKRITDYYTDFYFYSSFFKKKNIRRIFLTQNGILKAFLKAAQENRIPVFEFQHGLVDIGHLAYNYPKMDYKEGQITLPNTILSLSPFWFNELYLPNVKIVPIGNDYFYNPLAEILSTTNINTNTAKTILVISSDVFGKDLSDFILKSEKEGQLKDISIYFKLHPNQFFEKEYYTEKLSSLKNIRIITNEKSVGELLKICNTVFAIQSTAIYEALQANRKVILLKRMSYLRHQHIFDRKNLHLVDTVEDFISALNTEIVIDQDITFFAPFDKEAFLKAL